MTQHAALSAERWRRFDRSQQVLMVANEMQRLARRMRPEDAAARRLGYERVLNLTDLTLAVTDRRSFRRELGRWRDLIAELYVDDAPQRVHHAAALRALLQLEPTAAKQAALIGVAS